MDWSQLAHELYKAYHFDSIYSSITNVSIGVPSKTTTLLSFVRYTRCLVRRLMLIA